MGEGRGVAASWAEGDSSGPMGHLDSGSGHNEADQKTVLEPVDRESGDDKAYPREETEEEEVGNVGEEVPKLREGAEEEPEPMAMGPPPLPQERDDSECPGAPD